jgi:hypothetical protein
MLSGRIRGLPASEVPMLNHFEEANETYHVPRLPIVEGS